MGFFDVRVLDRPEQIRWDYFDVSDDERAWERSELTEGFRHDLIAAGFRPLGCVRAVLRAGGSELLDQVWIGEGGRVLVTASYGAELTTLFDDGTIVRTRTLEPMTAFTPGRWHHQTHPADRHDTEIIDGSIDTLLARHRVRVAKVEARTSVMVASAMPDYFAVRLRAAELRDARMWSGLHIAMHLTFVVCLAIGVCVVVLRSSTHGRHTFALFSLGALAAVIAFPVVHWAARLWVSPWITRLRPGPAPRPAAALVELGRAVPRGTLPDL